MEWLVDLDPTLLILLHSVVVGRGWMVSGWTGWFYVQLALSYANECVRNLHGKVLERRHMQEEYKTQKFMSADLERLPNPFWSLSSVPPPQGLHTSLYSRRRSSSHNSPDLSFNQSILFFVLPFSFRVHLCSRASLCERKLVFYKTHIFRHY